jgi:hypothetical protein
MAYVICFGIIGLILFALFVQVWDDAKEIGAEQQRRKDFREKSKWRYAAQHPLTDIKIIDGEGGGRLIIQGGHEKHEKHGGS